MTYDQHQLDAKLLICVKCGKKFHVTNIAHTLKGWICSSCR